MRRRFSLAVVVVAGVVLAVVAVVLLATKPWDKKSSRVLEYRNLTSSFPDVHYPRRDVFTFRDRESLEKHLEKKAAGEPINLPKIDFRREMLVVVAMGARSTAGYTLKPVRVINHNGKVQVQVRELSPDRDAIVAPVLTYPYIAIAIPRIGNEPAGVKFVDR